MWHRWKKLHRVKKILACLFLFFLLGFMLPEPFSMPVDGAVKADYSQESFWYYPWGRSGVHKGVDIFAREGTPVRASTYGFVYSTGYDEVGGNYIVILGPRWRFHYYAHLKTVETHRLAWISRREIIGSVGRTGNARNRPAHLHYSITTLFPYFWRADNSVQGGKKIWFIDPTPYLNAARD